MTHKKRWTLNSPEELEARIVLAAVSIDESWLAARGPAPYVLNQAGTTYVLRTDVSSPTTAFVVAAPGVVLDLNGHTVSYQNGTPIVVPNGGFESVNGSGVISSWDLSGAPNAEAGTNRFQFGDQVLRLKEITSKTDDSFRGGCHTCCKSLLHGIDYPFRARLPKQR